MGVFCYIFLSALVVSLIALVGALTFLIRDNVLYKLIFALVGLAAGTLLGGAVFHLYPKGISEIGYNLSAKLLTAGFVAFFVLERVLHWHHCHERECDIHTFSYLILIGDAIHNFIDGVVMAASYITSVALGYMTTLAIVMHEIPQELGDFGVLVYGGFSKKKALLYNFISQLTALAGAISAYFLFTVSRTAMGLHSYLLPFAAGGFLYIATSDLIPELHREKNLRKSLISMVLFLMGLALMMVRMH